MDHPLHCYLISSSRYSWMSTSDSLLSESSSDVLRRLLRGGCRFIELDCHDGVPDGPTAGEPEVYLSWTKSGRVKFRDCVQAVADSAFETNPYPVILSLDLHFGMEPDSARQMASVATILAQLLGDRLALWEPAGDAGSLQKPPGEGRRTPAGLLGKVLVKTEKRAQEMVRAARADPTRRRAASGDAASPADGLPPALALSSTRRGGLVWVEAADGDDEASGCGWRRRCKRLRMEAMKRPWMDAAKRPRLEAIQRLWIEPTKLLWVKAIRRL
eukprot:gene11640-3564_t